MQAMAQKQVIIQLNDCLVLHVSFVGSQTKVPSNIDNAKVLLGTLFVSCIIIS